MHHDIERNPIKSSSKILISGLGADEIFGGYSRYRNAFTRKGLFELYLEMQFDLERLWIRNLGRDDRVLSSNSIEARFPFLNIQMITQLKTVDFCKFTDFRMARGSGDKILLRKTAEMLGLG